MVSPVFVTESSDAPFCKIIVVISESQTSNTLKEISPNALNQSPPPCKIIVVISESQTSNTLKEISPNALNQSPPLVRSLW